MAHHFPLLRLFALLLFAVSASATNSAVAAAVPQPPITANCYLLSLGAPVRDLAINNKGQAQVLQIPNGNPGSPIHYQGPRQINFYPAASLANTGATHQTSEATTAIPEELQPVAQATLPQGKHPALLLFLPPQGQDTTMRVAALSINEQRFTPGSFYFQNFTPDTMAININGETVILPPQQNNYLPVANNADGNIVRMAKRNAQGAAELFYQSRWSGLGERRAWVFFLPGPDGQVQVHRYYDAPQARTQTR